jgi:hypothetical protein
MCLVLSSLAWENQNRVDFFASGMLPLLANCLESRCEMKTKAFAANAIAGICVADAARAKVIAEAGAVPFLVRSNKIFEVFGSVWKD